jgi:putative molybdopterin biosynthesis protein
MDAPHKPRIFIRTAPLDEAMALWRARLSEAGLWGPDEAEEVDVDESAGRVTAEPISARISSPFYHASAMDGYAVRFTDTMGASENSPRRLAIGTDAVYVDTGDPMPSGLNAVIMVEDVNVADGSIEFTAPVTPWQHVRVVGEDIVATELIVPGNHRIRPVDIGAMLAGGHTRVSVRRRPRVAFIPTGTEIVEPGSTLKPGDIIEYNSRVLMGLAREWGAEATRTEIVPDDPERLREALARACGTADLAVVIAGASTGSEDYTESTIRALGELILHGVAIRPGKPAMLGIVRGTPVIGTPGYPVATHLVFNLFGRPLIHAMLGLDQRPGPGTGETARAVLSRQIASSLGVEEFVRVKLGDVGGRLVATPLGRGAGLMSSLVRADGVLSIPPASEGMAGGAEVTVDLLKPLAEVARTVVSIGSHDSCMDLLGNALGRRHPGLSLSSAHVGSMGGLIALKKGEAHVAPTHMLDEETGEYNMPFIRRFLPDRDVVLVNLVHRTQGLMVLPGNPKGIAGLADLARQDVAFINRQRGAGTRMLLDMKLSALGIAPGSVTGYAREEYTHMAVASAVSTGLADTGLGVLSAARALGLDFIPVMAERYDLAIPAEHLEIPMVAALLGVIREDAGFRAALEALGGYGLEQTGRIVGDTRTL